MFKKTGFLAVALLLPSSALAQELPILSDAGVAAAFELADDDRSFGRVSDDCRAGVGWRDIGLAATGVSTPNIDVSFTTTTGVIASRFREARRRYMQLAVDDVALDDRVQVAWVSIRPRVEHMNDSALAELVQHAVIRPRGEDGPVFQPLGIEFDTDRHQNRFGMTAETATASATFDLVDVAEIVDGLDRDLDVVIITSAREQSCHLNKGNIRRAMRLSNLR